jgi:hypothetical protein
MSLKANAALDTWPGSVNTPYTAICLHRSQPYRCKHHFSSSCTLLHGSTRHTHCIQSSQPCLLTVSNIAFNTIVLFPRSLRGLYVKRFLWYTLLLPRFYVKPIIQNLGKNKNQYLQGIPNIDSHQRVWCCSKRQRTTPNNYSSNWDWVSLINKKIQPNGEQ